MCPGAVRRPTWGVSEPVPGGEASRFSEARGYLFKVKYIMRAVKSGQLG